MFSAKLFTGPNTTSYRSDACTKAVVKVGHLLSKKQFVICGNFFQIDSNWGFLEE